MECHCYKMIVRCSDTFWKPCILTPLQIGNIHKNLLTHTYATYLLLFAVVVVFIWG